MDVCRKSFADANLNCAYLWFWVGNLYNRKPVVNEICDLRAFDFMCFEWWHQLKTCVPFCGISAKLTALLTAGRVLSLCNLYIYAALLCIGLLCVATHIVLMFCILRWPFFMSPILSVSSLNPFMSIYSALMHSYVKVLWILCTKWWKNLYAIVFSVAKYVSEKF